MNREVAFPKVRMRRNRQELIQVCADPADAATRERELRALTDAAQEYPHASKRLLVLDREALARVDATDVTMQPVWEWLLTQPQEA